MCLLVSVLADHYSHTYNNHPFHFSNNNDTNNNWSLVQRSSLEQHMLTLEVY